MEEASISVEGRFMYLEKINSPADLAGLSVTELEQLAAEIRELVIETVSVNGGHLGASLGTVELILALHRVFKVPEDRLLFDVGHQAYAHKILTGRREFFKTLRRHGGCAGFPAAWESEFDVGASGHAGTAISTAVGLSAAFGRSGSPHRAVAVVGDGALNCGMSLEGMINASRQKPDRGPERQQDVDSGERRRHGALPELPDFGQFLQQVQDDGEAAAQDIAPA